MKKIHRNTIKLFIYIFVVVTASCANVVSPTGGPVDEEPPVMLKSTPPNYSAHYDGQDVRVYFNEYIQLDKLRENLLISPPLKYDPEIKVRGRSIIMSVSDTLLENTTYNFFFGESIVDITESNPIPNFQFVVSTGDYVDSLSVHGKVMNSFTLEPEEGVFVMMYDKKYDSVPMLERPVYLTKTNPQGEFSIMNMKEGEFKIFALRDMNSNFLYDNPDEEIAFLDSLIAPEYIGGLELRSEGEDMDKADSLNTDQDNDVSEPGQTLPDNGFPADSLRVDSMPQNLHTGFPYYQLYLFQEKDTMQRIASAAMTGKGKVNIAFRIPTDSVEIREYAEPFDEDWFIPEFNSSKDSLTLWLPDMERDTLELEISDRGHVVDSVTISLLQRPARGRTAARTEPDAEPVLGIAAPTIAGKGIHPYFEHFFLRSQTPLNSFEGQLFELYLNDSIPQEASFSFSDTVQRKLTMDRLLEPDSTYLLFIPPGSITDVFGAQNDTLIFSFKTNTEASYGSLILNLGLPEVEDKQFILQLLDEAMEEVVAEIVITGSDVYYFKHLAAANFGFRLIEDENKNGKWDTGHYLHGRQPEPVYIYPEKVQTRLNWEVEVLWDVDLD